MIPGDEGSGDLLSPLTETEYLQLLLRDLHDDLPGRITRLRYLGDQARTLGPNGSMISGGMNVRVSPETRHLEAIAVRADLLL